MTAIPVIDQELVVHFFAPLDGPQAESAYHQVRRLWAACRDQLEMTNPVAGMPAAAELPGTAGALPASDLVAVQENPDGNRQSVLRRLHDILNLSVVLAQPAPDGLPGGQLARIRSGRRLAWKDLAHLWTQACQQVGTDAMLGEAILLLARMPPGDTGAVAATPDLGQSLEPLLPPAAARLGDWRRWGSTTADGYGLWDLRPAVDTSSIREIVLIAAADRDAELSAWAWSDGTAAIPPFARYLLHAAKVRAEARLVDAWHRDRRAHGEMDADVDATWLASTSASPLSSAETLRFRISGLRGEEGRLRALAAELRSLRQTVTIARDNLRAAAGRDADGEGMFTADQAQAQWLLRQTEGDLAYLEIDIDRTANIRALADEELAQAERASPARDRGAARGDPREPEPEPEPKLGPARGAASAPGAARAARQVFVVHGRDDALAARFRELLRAVDLQPLDWEALVGVTGSAAPYLGQVVAAAPHQAQATLVLLSPDDIVELHSDLRLANDHPYERARAAQARPNVLFELGMALMAYPERTVVVEVGEMRQIADLAGLNTIRFDGSALAIRKVVTRLEQAGCKLDDSGTDWLDHDRFAGLACYQRGPATHREDH